MYTSVCYDTIAITSYEYQGEEDIFGDEKGFMTLISRNGQQKGSMRSNKTHPSPDALTMRQHVSGCKWRQSLALRKAPF